MDLAPSADRVLRPRFRPVPDRPFDLLPAELVRAIATKLPLDDRQRLAQCNRALRRAATERDWWTPTHNRGGHEVIEVVVLPTIKALESCLRWLRRHPVALTALHLELGDGVDSRVSDIFHAMALTRSLERLALVEMTLRGKDPDRTLDVGDLSAAAELRLFHMNADAPPLLTYGTLPFGIETLELSNVSGDIPDFDNWVPDLRRLEFHNMQFKCPEDKLAGWIGAMTRLEHLVIMEPSTPWCPLELDQRMPASLTSLTIGRLPGAPYYKRIGLGDGHRELDLSRLPRLRELGLVGVKVIDIAPGQTQHLSRLQKLHLEDVLGPDNSMLDPSPATALTSLFFCTHVDYHNYMPTLPKTLESLQIEYTTDRVTDDDDYFGDNFKAAYSPVYLGRPGDTFRGHAAMLDLSPLTRLSELSVRNALLQGDVGQLRSLKLDSLRLCGCLVPACLSLPAM